MPKTSNFKQPEISTPKGGGAIQGINEQFQANSFTGAAGFSIPLPLTAARGLEPSLAISYSSGGGNGICGMGATLNISGITRKTTNGIPAYDDKDVFLLQGAELVPKLSFNNEKGQWLPVTRTQDNWQTTTYRPRLEGAFQLIELWQHTAGFDSYWVVTASGNQQTTYGKSTSARIADPARPERIFSWMPETETDEVGNLIRYNYELDEKDNNAYLTSVQYGNYVMGDATYFAFTAVIDYGTFNPATPDIMPSGYRERPDPFSLFISGFGIRNSRLVYHVLLYHQFAGQYGGQPFLTKSADLHYGDTNTEEGNTASLSGLSFLRSIAITGYQKQEDGSYAVKAMPPLEMAYTPFQPAAQRYQTLMVENGGQIPGYLHPQAYQMVDLHNDGLPGLLYSNDQVSFYYEPLGNGRYRAPVTLEGFPVDRDLGAGQNVLLSLSGNGIKELVVEHEGRSGYYTNTAPGMWAGFKPFELQASEAFTGNKQWVDLTGDGLADLVLFEQDTIKYYPSLRTQGYGAARRAFFSEGFPATDDNSEEELLTFAGILGDGLQHYVRIRNGSVECWPNMGYGRFGAVRRLQHAPRLNGCMDARRLRLADIDGSGTADIIYLEHNHAKIWFNQSGNRFSDPIEIPLPVSYDQLSQVSFADVNGTGTTCMIVTVTEPEVRHYYYDFAGGEKPYLLHTTRNNVGASATYHYTTSVKQYLRDKREGRPWPTRLFFPVHVVAAIETTDEPSGAFHIQRFTYHDGYYDPVERAFRGFGFTESMDTDHFEVYAESSANKGFPVNTINRELHVPPVLTKSWYHTGTYLEAGNATAFYRKEYFSGDAAFYSISGQVLEPGIAEAGAETLRQAYAAMEGQLLRQEVYGLDGAANMQNPYTVTETEIYIRLEQPMQQQRYAVFLPFVRQSMSWQYERDAADPRVTHSFSLLVNDWGAVTRSCNIYYPRRAAQGQFVFPEQKELKITVDCAGVVSDAQPDSYYINVPVDRRSYEVAGMALPETGYFTFNEIQQGIDEALQHTLEYQAPFAQNGPAAQARLYHWEQHYYWNGDQQSVLPPGAISTPLLPHHSETAVYPEAALHDCYSGFMQPSGIGTDTGYIVHDKYYWNAGLSQYYLPQNQYCLPLLQQNDFAPEHNIALQPVTTVRYDDYYLRAVGTTAALSGTAGITVTSEIDYRAMQTWRVTDPNENVSEVLFDPLGYVMVTTAYGNVFGKSEGNLPVSSYQVIPASVDEVMAQPQQYLQNAGSYFYYDLFAWMDRGTPVCAIALQAQLYTSQVRHGQDNPVKTGIVFSDGFGRPLVSKSNADAGSTGVHDRDGNWIYTSRTGAGDWSDNRWACSGQTVYNNKGNPAQQFQPYFSDGWQYGSPDTLIDLQQLTPPSILHYDAPGRVVRTDDPKGFFSKTTFTPWESRQFDANDTILDAPYYLRHKDQIEKIREHNPASGTRLPGAEVDAIRQAAACYNSPGITILDTMGRSVRSVADKLGAVTAGKLMPVLQDAAAVQAALSDLVAAGWLIADTGNQDVYWLTAMFQPYTAGFAAGFTIGGASSAALLNLLKDGRLTMLQQYDIQGRLLQSVDPRLLWSDLTAHTGYFNFRYQYMMAGGLLKTVSADAGPRIQLANIFSGNVYFWDARGFCTCTVYDQLQRKIQTVVSGGDGADSGTRICTLTLFGEYAPDAAAHNLIGQPWKIFDDAGAVVTQLCGIRGQVMEEERYFRADYKTGADWNETAQADVLTQAPFPHWSEHNALGLPIRSVNPDGSVYLPVYNTAGQLSQIEMIFASGAGKEPVPLLRSAMYDPGGKPVYLEYGNGTAIRTTIEATTQRVLNQRSYRTGTPKGDADLRLQEIHYTYDPAGNITAKRDNSWQHIFNENQQVQPLSQYEYDLLYQLARASGRQLKQAPEISGSARQFMQDQGIPARWARPGDQQALENYTEQYTYDEAGNLVQRRHHAVAQHTCTYTMAEDSNRLAMVQKPVAYDANGNLQTLEHLAAITWNYQNQLVSAVAIARSGAPADAEYYQYDAAGNRVRKVTERLMHGGTQQEIEEKYYIGPYQYKKISQVAVGDEKSAPAVFLEKHSLKISGPNGLCCITHYWAKDATGRETKDRQRIYRYQYTDVLRSAGLETNDKGALLSYEEYYPYGGTAFTVAANALEISLKEYRYSGQEKDSFTGLYYYGMRYYPPWLCRWMNPDPAGTIDGLNLYTFVGSNPVTRYDVGGMLGKRKSGPGTKPAAKRRKTEFGFLGVMYGVPPTNNELSARAEQLGTKIAQEVKKTKKSYRSILQALTSGTEGDDLLAANNQASHLRDDLFERAFNTVMQTQSHNKANKTKFATDYRKAHDAQDEHVSTAMIYHLLVGASRVQLDEDKMSELQEGFRLVSRYRLPTQYTGVSTKDGFMQHPTELINSKNAKEGINGVYGTRPGPHNEWNNKRANFFLTIGEYNDEKGVNRLYMMAKSALGFTLGSAFADPNAPNITPRLTNTGSTGTTWRELAKNTFYNTDTDDERPAATGPRPPDANCEQFLYHVPGSPLYNSEPVQTQPSLNQ